MAESSQHWLDRNRPPRVQITYDVETGGAIEKIELPFVTGILSDLSGKRDPEKPLPPLKERKFVEIDRDNFNQVLESIGPRLAFRVDNKLQDDADDMLNVELTFADIEDFGPVEVLSQIEPLHKLYDARQRLRDLLTKLDGNDDLDSLLNEIVQNTEQQTQLRKELEAAAPAGEASKEAEKGANGASKDKGDAKK